MPSRLTDVSLEGRGAEMESRARFKPAWFVAIAVVAACCAALLSFALFLGEASSKYVVDETVGTFTLTIEVPQEEQSLSPGDPEQESAVDGALEGSSQIAPSVPSGDAGEESASEDGATSESGSGSSSAYEAGNEDLNSVGAENPET